MNNNLFLASLVATAAVFAPIAHAAEIAEDQYNGLFTGFSNQFTGTASPTGLTFSQDGVSLDVAGGSFFPSGNPRRQLTAEAGALLGNTADYYISFLLDSTNDTTSRAGLTLFAVGGEEIVEFGQESGVASLLTGQSNGFVRNPSTQAITSEVHLFVLRVNNDADPALRSLALFYDPTPGVEPTTPDATYTGAQNLPAFALGEIRAQGLQDNQPSALDEIRMGNTFADVTPVPEPTAFVALLSGAAVTFGLRRRKS